jgi:ketosteroid isomerase-like protein
MRSVFIFSFLLSVLSFTAQSQHSLDKEAFHHLLLQSFDDIFSQWKSESIHQYYTADFTILEDGKVWNKDSVTTAINTKIASGQQIKRSNAITVLEFFAEGDLAWGSYYNEATIRINGSPERKVRWLESAVLVKQPNGWRIRLLHSTRIRQ